MATTQQSINTTRDRGEKKSLRLQWKALQKELRSRQKKAVKDTLDGCSVTCTTLIGAASSACAAYHYDVVIIDEAAQAIECACLIPMLLCQRRLVLAGDHHQLGPVVKSEAAAKGGLSRTLMDRITSRADAASLMLMLDQQYRMNDEIMTWTSKEFYDGRLQAPDEVKDRRLTQLKGVKATHLTRAPILFIDTAGCEMHEDEDDSAKSNPSQPSLFAQSKSNKHEVALILRHLRLLLADGVPLSSITVLSPYLAQLSLLRDLLLPLYPALEVGTIDSMQGRENDAILISMVRSNASGVVGFLSESRRMNVAITRAKAHVCVVGDSDTVTKDRFLHRLIDYISGNEQAEYISAMEYQDDGVVLEAKATPAPSVPLSASAAQPEIRTIKAAGATPAAKATSVGTEAAAVGEQAAAPVVETFDRERITRLCEEVLTGALPSFIFPASLSVDDRRVVHEVADEVGQGALQHLSEGRKHKRVITLRKQSPPAAVSTALPLPARPAAPATSSKSSAPSASSSARAKSGGRATGAAPPSAPSASREELRMAALARMEAAAKPHQVKALEPVAAEAAAALLVSTQSALQATAMSFSALQDSDDGEEAEEGTKQDVADDEKAPATAAPLERHSISTTVTVSLSPDSALSPTSKASKGKGGSSSKKAASAASPEDEEDLDDFLDGLAKGVSVCASGGCSRPVMVNGAVCPFCHLRFCLGHANGILHGCAADAKQAALARDLHSLHSTRQGRTVSGLKEDKRQQLAGKALSKASAARQAGEEKSKKKQDKDKKT